MTPQAYPEKSSTKISTKGKNILILLSIIQIFLLANFCVAQSYQINETDKIFNLEINEISKKLMKSGLNLLIGFLSIKQIGFVSAVELNCCLETTEGATCQNIISTETDNCVDGKLLARKCELTDQCKTGCCYDSTEGLCSSSPQKSCEDDYGTWSADATCSSDANCVKGCCVIGRELQFITSARCTKLSAHRGVTKDFRSSVITEPECLSLPIEDKDGACVFSDGTCRRKLSSQCSNVSMSHYPRYLCSNSNLERYGVDCAQQSSVGCVTGKDEIYWFDSCGNRENIYEGNSAAGKTSSYNNGQILSKGESCIVNLLDPTSVETCGNCDRFTSSKCVATTEDPQIDYKGFVCQSLNCTDINGNIRQNGETWCGYDNKIWNETNNLAYSSDSVGSSHWKMWCDEGTIKSKNCGDYRNFICAEKVISELGFDYSIGECVMNQANQCILYNNNGEDVTTQCNANPQCRIQGVDVGPKFKFSMCVPKYPRGHNFNMTVDTTSCGAATVTCPVVYEKNWLGEKECDTNCRCRNSEFAQEMNDLCISLGDCGSYINWVGNGSNNVAISGHRSPSPIPWESYNDSIIHAYGEYAKDFGNDTQSGIEKKIGDIVEYLGLNEEFTKLKDASGGFATIWGINKGLIAAETTIGPWKGSMASWNFMSGFATYAGFIIAGMAIGDFLARDAGVSPEIAQVYVLAGGIGGAAAASFIVHGATTGGWIGVIVAVVVIAWLKIFGVGELSTENIAFTCQPWQPPTHGNDCDKCDDDPLKPCTRYRCESLGQNCDIINFGLVEHPECVEININDLTTPLINPTNNISLGYEFYETVQDTSTNIIVNGTTASDNESQCVKPFDKVRFMLETDEYAQCRWSLIPDSYLNMTPAAEQTLYTLNHTFEFTFPSISSLEHLYGIQGNITKELYGNLSMYVKCKDKNNGNTNVNPFAVNFCVRSGPDMTAVSYNAFEPANNERLIWNETNKNITMWINKPAECKWDTLAHRRYNDMANTMACTTDQLIPVGINGWNCTTTLTGLTGPENTTYFKCKNNPWQTNESLRFANSQDYPYVLKTSISELKIHSKEPSTNIFVGSGGSDYPITLEIVTSGGAEGNGLAICKYKYNWGTSSDNNWYNFAIASTNTHQKTLNLESRNYDIPIKCTDLIGNLVEGNITFNLTVDNLAPEIATIYRSGSSLEITTYELSRCYYNTESATCDVPLKDSTNKMETGIDAQVIHNVDWDDTKTYHIQCVDTRNNLGTCMSISPSTF